MDSMESLIRLRLGQKENAIMRKYISEHPELKEELNSALRQYLTSVDSACTNMPKKISEELKKHKFDRYDIEFCLSNILPMINNLTHNLADVMATQFTLDHLVNDAGKPYYASEPPETSGKGDSFDALMKIALAPYHEAVQVRQVIASRLADKAKKSGIESAVNDNAVYAAWREIFPTKESYMQYIERQSSASKAAFKSLIPLLVAGVTVVSSDDGEHNEKDDAESNLIVGTLAKTLFESTLDTLPYAALSKVRHGISEMEAAKIYLRAKKK